MGSYKTKLDIEDKFWWVKQSKIGPMECETCGGLCYKETGKVSLVEDKVNEIFITDGPAGSYAMYNGVKSKELGLPESLIPERLAYKSKASAKRAMNRIREKQLLSQFSLAC